MNIKSILSVIVVLFGSATISFAQKTSDVVKPKWLHKLPTSINTTFRYKVIASSALTLESARTNAVQSLIDEIGMEAGVVIISNHKSKETVSQVWENGKLREVIKNDMETINTVKGEAMPLYASYIDEYWTRDNSGTYHLQRLYAQSESPIPDYFETTSSYLSDPAAWGLALVPGATQFYKNSYLKGGVILGGTVLLAGGIIFTENQRADYVRKIAGTHNADIKRAYITKSDHFATGRNICIGALAALYVYNLIDAVVAPGARRVVVRQHDGKTYAFLPTISYDGTPVLTASVTF